MWLNITGYRWSVRFFLFFTPSTSLTSHVCDWLKQMMINEVSLWILGRPLVVNMNICYTRSSRRPLQLCNKVILAPMRAWMTRLIFSPVVHVSPLLPRVFPVWMKGSPRRSPTSTWTPPARWGTTGPCRWYWPAAWRCTPFRSTSRTAVSPSAAGFTQVCFLSVTSSQKPLRCGHLFTVEDVSIETHDLHIPSLNGVCSVSQSGPPEASRQWQDFLNSLDLECFARVCKNLRLWV